ncbi:hypothetical protein WMF20_23915 [Sorangium sp. So ce834]|uniref:hypothetical protein n=1 Tax=Sorangium sp. So ce834 TaxID=3133321 RepID=UPI003F6437EF
MCLIAITAAGMLVGCGDDAPAQDDGVASAALQCSVKEGAAPALLALCAIPGTVGQHLPHMERARFDYDPPGLAMDRIHGRYTPRRGAISWKETPAADSYLRKTKAQGSVTRTANGAVATYDRETIEDSGAVHVTEVEETFQRVERTEGDETFQRCLLTRRTRPAGGGDLDWLTQQGEWDGTSLSYTQERISRTHGGRIQLDGQLQADGSWTESYGGRYGWSDVSESWSGDADGNTLVYWERNWGDEYVWGTDARARDGSLHRYIRHVYEWCVPWDDLTVQADGTGSGSARICVPFYDEESGYEDVVYAACTIAVANGSCAKTCDNGVVYSCNDLL